LAHLEDHHPAYRVAVFCCVEAVHPIRRQDRIEMKQPFPHTYFLASALVLASGGMAMTTAVLSGDHDAMLKLLDTYIDAFGTGVLALVGFAVHAKLNE
jgi:hypothetical protein